MREGERGGKNEGKWVGGKAPESTFEKLRFFRSARLFIILFVRNFRRVCSQFRLSLFEVFFLLMQMQEEIHHFAGWEGGG